MFFRQIIPAFVALLSSNGWSADIVLSPDGPLSTPQAAREAARGAPKPVRILVSDGTYRVTEALELEAADSGVTWEAAPGAQPIFDGGRRVTGWTPAENGLWKAPAPADAGLFDQVWINGRRATPARSPNRGYFHLADPVAEAAAESRTQFRLKPAEFSLLSGLSATERERLLITVTHAWAVGQCRVKSIDAATRTVTIKGQSRYPFGEKEPDQRYWMEHYRAALDAPGEWYHDRERAELLYHPLPGEDMTQAEVVVPVADRFLLIRGASEITIRGLRFRHGQYLYPAEGQHDGQAATTIDGAIEIADSRKITIEDCEIAHVGRYAIYFRNGCTDSVIRHCHLHDLGAGGVRIGETDRPEEDRICRDIVVDDCIIHQGGRLHPSACGVVMTHARRCAVTHCDIGQLYYTGVSIGWHWGYGESLGRENRVENCHIHHLGRAYLSDMGGFYGLGNAPGTVIRGNHIHHIASHRYGGWGLYTDEGSGDVLMENNLVHDTSEAGFHQHYGYANRVRNNLFAFGRKAQIQRSRNEPRLSFIYERNIVLWDPGAPLLDGSESNWSLRDQPGHGEPRDTAIFRRNLYWTTDGKLPATLTKTHYSWDDWRRLGRDAGSAFADPKFIDPARRDFRLQPDSPAATIGFVPWDLSLAGVRSEDAAWRKLAEATYDDPEWEKDAVPWPAPAFQIDLETFETTAPGQIGLPRTSYDKQNKGESIGVTAEMASPLPLEGQSASRRSLMVRDAPGLAHSYDPVLDIFPRWPAGTYEAAFDIMAREGADWFFEMRASTGEFAAGPYIRWQGGVLSANNTSSRKLADLPAGEWCRVTIRATTGAGHYRVTLTRQDGSTAEFPDIPCQPDWSDAGYLLFSGLGTTDTAFFIDNFRLNPLPQPP
ncbi:MAG: right-handed parallel beta-helix repeat-containing protein [Verrucomicrobiales bacterium]|nr:right-handed parallel beta-helix repeat-containing protein [Verrucomicrobiales bacterium]